MKACIYSSSYQMLTRKLKLQRIKKKFTQVYISSLLNIPQKKISDIENNIQKISLEELILMCHILELSFINTVLEYERDFFLEFFFKNQSFPFN